MEEIKTIQQEEKPKGLLAEIAELKKFKEEVTNGSVKAKKIRIPKKAKVKRRKLKQGWVGIIKVDENRNISGEKQKLLGGAFKDSDGVYHASDGREILFWEGKFPVVVQETWRTNPVQFNPKEDKHETYGDKYKMAKMLADTIKVKSKGGGNIIIWLLIAGGALVGINYLMGGGLFG